MSYLPNTMLKNSDGPSYLPYTEGSSQATIDREGNLKTRSIISGDESGYIVNYSGSDVAITGPLVRFYNGSTTADWTFVSGSSPRFKVGEYIKSRLDGDNLYVQIGAISTTHIYFVTAYQGSNGYDSTKITVEKPSYGGTIGVSSGKMSITTSTVNNSVTESGRLIDTHPLVTSRKFSISQRIANNEVYMGIYDPTASTGLFAAAQYWAIFKFSGTDNTKVITSTAHNRSGIPSATDKEEYTVSIPGFNTTYQSNEYRIEVDYREIRFYINDIIVSTHDKVIFGYKSDHFAFINMTNIGTPASGSTIYIDNTKTHAYNKVNVGLLDKDSTLFDTEVPKDFCPAIPVRVAPANSWKTSFCKVLASTVDSSFFNTISLGGGQTISQSGGNLLLVAGTTINSETILRSTRSFSDQWSLSFFNLHSSRIINNNFIIELVDVIGDSLNCTINSATSVTVTIPNNPFDSTNIGQSMNIGAISGAAGIPGRFVIASVTATTVTFTVASWPASGSCTVSLFGWNYHQYTYNGATATSLLYDAQRQGWNSGTTTLTANTSLSPGHLNKLVNADGYSSASQTLIASSTALTWTQYGHRMQNLPDTNCKLYIQIRSLNGGTTPAASTTWTIGSISVEEYSPVGVEYYGNKVAGGNSAQPVTIYSGTVGTVTTLSTITAGNNLIADVGIQYRANATGGATIKHIIAAAGTNGTIVKASAGRVVGWTFVNTTAAYKYVKLYNSATVTVGTTTVVQTIAIPPNSVNSMPCGAGSIGYSTGICLSITNLPADADTTVVVANDVIGDLFYM